MKVFKFGGASVKDAEAVKNVAKIISLFSDDLVIVISAMGKTTNALEKVINAYFSGDSNLAIKLAHEVITYHKGIIQDLELNDDDFAVLSNRIFNELLIQFKNSPSDNYAYEYDQIVSLGEVFSTFIVAGYLNHIGVETLWMDARKLVRTDNSYREGKVNWDITKELVTSKMENYLMQKEKSLVITQGFIGHTDTNQTTTLGREGSDFSAAIFAWCLNAENVTIWKDVPGMLNADPKHFNNCQKLDSISYREAIELSYFGASVIHPKTVKPLQNKNISLFVKSFINPEENGTEIQGSIDNDTLIPSYIFKQNQILLSISPRDFSFIEEDNLSKIFDIFSKHSVKINLMQNSALSFSVCADNIPEKITPIINELSHDYLVKYNDGSELLTVRHYNEAIISTLTANKEILVEQKTRQTARLVMK